MPKETQYTKAFEKAHASINRSFQLALDRTGRVPIGHHILDPRTVAKNSAFNLDDALSSQGVESKEFDFTKHPLPKDKGPNPKTAAAGKVVDPTAIETFQGADNTTLDQVGSQGLSGGSILEGP